VFLTRPARQRYSRWPRSSYGCLRAGDELNLAYPDVPRGRRSWRRASAGQSVPEGAVDGQNALQTALYRYALAASPVLGSGWIWSAGAGVLVLRSKTLRRRPFLSGGRSRSLVPARVRPVIGWTSVRPSVEAPPLPSHERVGPTRRLGGWVPFRTRYSSRVAVWDRESQASPNLICMNRAPVDARYYGKAPGRRVLT
jgi:hypothetical protein